MSRTVPSSIRSGITPVVAIVLLLMMTVAAAGGAYAWVEGIIGDAEGQGEDTLDRDVQLRDLVCYDNSTVEFFLANVGTAEVDANAVTIYQYETASGDLMTSTDTSYSGGILAVNDDWSDTTGSALNAMTAGADYRIEFEFDNEDGYMVTGSCQARNS